MHDDVTVTKNVDATLNLLTEHEADVRDYIMMKYFVPIKQKHWEGVEVEKYWQRIAKQ